MWNLCSVPRYPLGESLMLICWTSISSLMKRRSWDQWFLNPSVSNPLPIVSRFFCVASSHSHQLLKIWHDHIWVLERSLWLQRGEQPGRKYGLRQYTYEVNECGNIGVNWWGYDFIMWGRYWRMELEGSSGANWLEVALLVWFGEWWERWCQE